MPVLLATRGFHPSLWHFLPWKLLWKHGRVYHVNKSVTRFAYNFVILSHKSENFQPFPLFLTTHKN